MKLLILAILLTGCSGVINTNMQEAKPKQAWCIVDNEDTIKTIIVSNDTIRNVVTVRLDNGKLTKFKYK